MPVPAWTDADFLVPLQQHLPTGRAWPREPDAVLTQTLGGLVPTTTRQAARAANLITDAFPASTTELLPEWEYTLGLPDPCAGVSPTIELRRSQVVARFTAGGGQSITFFVDLAATLGYAVTIEQFKPRRFGDKFGTPFYGPDWAFAWRVNAPQFTVTPRRFGDAFGEPYATWGNTVLQCEMQRLSPAHTIVTFSYS